MISLVDEDAIAQWAPDWLWEIAVPLIPAGPVRPQGGGRRRVDDRRVLAAVLYLTRTGYSWWKLPEDLFGVTRATAHRRFAEWTAAGLWEQLHRAALDRNSAGAAGDPASTGPDVAEPLALIASLASQPAKRDTDRTTPVHRTRQRD